MISIGFLFFLAYIVLMVVSLWKIFEKAGKQGWAALIPIYNLVVLLQIAGKPDWWALLMLLMPITHLIFLPWTYNMLSKSFGKDEGFTLGLLFLGIIFFPLLAFGDAEYEGPYGDPVAYQAYKRKTGRGLFDFDQSL